jgi:hypothetical protein
MREILTDKLVIEKKNSKINSTYYAELSKTRKRKSLEMSIPSYN